MTIRTRSALVLLLLAPACARPNPVFQSEAGAGTVGDAGSAEGGAGSGDTSASEGSASGDTGAATSGGHGSSSGASTGWYGTSSTGEPIECDIETKMECSIHDGLGCDNDGESCVPWTRFPGDRIIDTYCFPFGQRGLGEECLPGCMDEPEVKCRADLVCDAPEGEIYGKCRLPCSGSFESPSCDEGLCYQFHTDGYPYGICRGTCNPTGGEPCPGEEVCAVDTGQPSPRCVLDDAPREFGQSCDEHVCGVGLICVDESLFEGCDAGRCCALLCDPPVDDTCAPGICMQVPEDHGIVDIGYCVP